MYRHQPASSRLFSVLCSLVLLSFLPPLSARAETVFVSSDSGNTGLFVAGDFVVLPDRKLGAGETNEYPSPLVLPTAGGRTVTMKQQGGSFRRLDQGDGFVGDFKGDPNEPTKLIWTNDGLGPIEFTFTNPVKGAGAQIQANAFNFDFTATISGTDGSGTPFRFKSGLYPSTQKGDGSALFIGALDDLNGIRSIAFDVTVPSAAGLDHNFVLAPLQLVVPLPAAVWLFASALLGFGASSRYRGPLKA